MKKIVVDEKCIGCGACVAIDPTHFDFDNELGTSKVISQENIEAEAVAEAMDACPVGAIFLAECEGCPNCTCQKEEMQEEVQEGESEEEVALAA